RDCSLVPPQMSLQQLVEEHVLMGGRRCFFVTDNDRLHGLLTLTDVGKVPRADWPETTAGRVMVPRERLVQVQPHTTLLSALQVMDDANVNQVPVVTGDRLVGMLSRQQVLHYIRARAELGM
ncbi:MAG: CBS domain-containing protein, partial [Chloroflexi bacterium]|nr:CBS domain-containing protein [Chloroflexota bacterium]